MCGRCVIEGVKARMLSRRGVLGSGLGAGAAGHSVWPCTGGYCLGCIPGHISISAASPTLIISAPDYKGVSSGTAGLVALA